MNKSGFDCIRECPEEAIVPAVLLAQIEVMVRERVETFDEKPPTRIFFGTGGFFLTQS